MRGRFLLAAALLASCHRGVPVNEGTDPNHALGPATLTGRILDRSTGKALERASITLRPRESDSEAYSATSGPSGEFQFMRIAPGNYEISLAARGFQPQASTLRLQPRQNRKIEVSLSPVAIPCPRVRTGQPLPGCG
jgi:hypothetical protein